MKGILVYSKKDIKKNVDYISWLVNEGKKKDIHLEVKTDEEIRMNGIKYHTTLDFIINRSRSYELSLLFELNNIKVFNNSKVTLLGNNKLSAYAYAKKKNYEFPEVLLDSSIKNQVISKPNAGHGGVGIHLVTDESPIKNTHDIQQKYLSGLLGDIRFYIINNEIINAVIRFSNEKIVSNYAQGGNFEIYDFSEKERQYIKEFMKGTTFDYVGLDFFLNKEDELIFNEIEDVVGSRMLSKLGINNTTELYLDHIYQTIKNKKNTK